MKLCRNLILSFIAVALFLMLPQVVHAAITCDVDGDRTITQNDVVYLLLHSMFGETAYPLNDVDADINGNGEINQDDVVYLLLRTLYGEAAFPLKHNYISSVTEPTCTEDGYTTFRCEVCDHTYIGDYVAALNHSETETETKEADCLSGGYTKVICTVCNKVISNTTIPANGTHEFVVKRMSDAVKIYIDRNDYSYSTYVNCKDWNVDMCKRCDYIKLETLRFAYSDYEAAYIMLGYVNSLRESIYGTSDYNLELNSTLIELAKIRAKEISISYGHGGTYTNAGENINRNDGVNIYDHFVGWRNSTGHYNNMIDKTYKYFGYALYKSTNYYSMAEIYGVQLFWSENHKLIYMGG